MDPRIASEHIRTAGSTPESGDGDACFVTRPPLGTPSTGRRPQTRHTPFHPGIHTISDRAAPPPVEPGVAGGR